MKKHYKAEVNQIKKGQLYKSKSTGLSKDNIIKIMGQAGNGFWKTIRVDTNAPKRVPTHSIRAWDLLKYYEKI